MDRGLTHIEIGPSHVAIQPPVITIDIGGIGPYHSQSTGSLMIHYVYRGKIYTYYYTNQKKYLYMVRRLHYSPMNIPLYHYYPTIIPRNNAWQFMMVNVGIAMS